MTEPTPTLPRWAYGIAAVAATALLLRALPEPESPWVWWSMRSLGLVAIFASWLTMLFGIFVSGKGAGGMVNPPIIVVLHRTWASVAALTTVLHIGAAIADPRVSPLSALIPFTSSILRGPVTLGTIALWLGALLFASQHFPRTAWRAIHAGAFGGFLLALIHAVVAGTDTPVLRFGYAAVVAVLIGAVIQRIAVTLLAEAATASRPVAPAPRAAPPAPTEPVLRPLSLPPPPPSRTTMQGGTA